MIGKRGKKQRGYAIRYMIYAIALLEKQDVWEVLEKIQKVFGVFITVFPPLHLFEIRV